MITTAAGVPTRKETIKAINRTHGLCLNAAHRFHDFLERHKIAGAGKQIMYRNEAYVVAAVDGGRLVIDLSGRSDAAAESLQLNFLTDTRL